jgi:hypothetical protein
MHPTTTTTLLLYGRNGKVEVVVNLLETRAEKRLRESVWP